jgi:hypothetical protein
LNVVFIARNVCIEPRCYDPCERGVGSGVTITTGVGVGVGVATGVGATVGCVVGRAVGFAVAVGLTFTDGVAFTVGLAVSVGRAVATGLASVGVVVTAGCSDAAGVLALGNTATSLLDGSGLASAAAALSAASCFVVSWIAFATPAITATLVKPTDHFKAVCLFIVTATFILILIFVRIFAVVVLIDPHIVVLRLGRCNIRIIR